MKKTLLTLLFATTSYCGFSQAQIITTGNNVIDSSNPLAADIVIGSNWSTGIRHDASIMWWSNASADRISVSGDTFYFSPWLSTTPNIGLSAFSGATSYFQGNLLIGQTTQINSSYKLDVNGTARAKEVVVNTLGSDFVFDPAYKLYPLSFVKKYIDLNHHLPEIPSAIQMQTNGLDLGDNQMKLLQKVEELTLYTIAADKKIEDEAAIVTQQNTQLLQQQAQIKAQQAQIDALNKKMELVLNTITNK